jgi:hypothetical protein
MDLSFVLAWVYALGPQVLYVFALAFSIRKWGWVPGLWLILLGVVGAIGTVLIQQQDQWWLFWVVAILAFPLGLLLPMTVPVLLYYHSIWFGMDLAQITLPMWYGIAFALCGMLQVFTVFVIKERRDRHKGFRERQEEVARLKDESLDAEWAEFDGSD